MLVALELPDRAQVFRSMGTAQQSYWTVGNRVDPAIADAIEIANAASVTQASASPITVEQDTDVLVGGQISGG
ncbi:MAG: hypothetical protein AAGB05_08050 [Pseudomonadota bacterium]